MYYSYYTEEEQEKFDVRSFLDNIENDLSLIDDELNEDLFT